MDYKKIIKSRNTRLLIMKCLGFIPDKMMLKIQYRIKFGRNLNLKTPQRFTEKLQWYKLYYHNPLMRQCADKIDVRDYVKKCGLENILIPSLGVYTDENKIDFDKLPNQFVLKDSLGGGGTAVIICKDKKQFDINKARQQMRQWLKSSSSYKTGGREWVYGGKKHRILIEQYLPSIENDGGLIDYKFFCFNGEPQFLYIITDRKVGEAACFGIYTADFKKLNVVRNDELPLTRNIQKPIQYEDMLKIARKLSKPFPEARVDLYCVQDKIYFGEITFFDGSGYMSFTPDEFDFTLGEKFILPNRK